MNNFSSISQQRIYASSNSNSKTIGNNTNNLLVKKKKIENNINNTQGVANNQVGSIGFMQKNSNEIKGLKKLINLYSNNNN